MGSRDDWPTGGLAALGSGAVGERVQGAAHRQHGFGCRDDVPAGGETSHVIAEGRGAAEG